MGRGRPRRIGSWSQLACETKQTSMNRRLMMPLLRSFLQSALLHLESLNSMAVFISSKRRGEDTAPYLFHLRFRLTLQLIQRRVLADVWNQRTRPTKSCKPRGPTANHAELGFRQVRHFAVINRERVVGAIFVNEGSPRATRAIRQRRVRGDAMHENCAARR